MATASAFGFSGWDALGSYGEGLMGQHFLDKSAKTQYKYARKYAKWSALNGPTYTRQGLVDAGYNPMLAVSQGFDMPAFQTTGTPPSFGNSVNGYDPTVMSALQTQKAERELLKAQKEKVETETGAMAPIKAIVSAIPHPLLREAVRGLFQQLFSTDGNQNAEHPAPTQVEKIRAVLNNETREWSKLPLKQAEHDASKLGLEGKERHKYIEKRRRLWNGEDYRLHHYQPSK